MFKNRSRHIVAAFFLCSNLAAKAFTPNYEEANVGIYTLPDPLFHQDGSRVTKAETWFNQRRLEIQESYRENIFRYNPATGTNTTFNVW